MVLDKESNLIKHFFLFFYLVTFFAASLPFLYINYVSGNIIGLILTILGMVVLVVCVIALYMNFNPKIQIGLNALGLLLFGLPAGFPFLLVIAYWLFLKYLRKYLHL